MQKIDTLSSPVPDPPAVPRGMAVSDVTSSASDHIVPKHRWEEQQHDEQSEWRTLRPSPVRAGQEQSQGEVLKLPKELALASVQLLRMG